MLTVPNTALLVIDFQGKLAQVVHDSRAVLAEAAKLIRGAKALDLPILWTEQNPAGLGPTVPELAELLPGQPIPKFAFSCCGEEGFVAALKALDRHQVLLCGIEAHVCVYQTAADLLTAGYQVHVAADAVSSRSPQNTAVGLARMQSLGAAITSVEMALFELLRVAQGDRFREILNIVR